jgi:galactokinase
MIVEIARRQPGCYGACMTGAGFGGCALALVHDGAIEALTINVSQQYEQETGLIPSVYITRAAEGANTTRLTI